MYRLASPDKRRPVLVISRADAIRVLSTVMVAPVTSAIRGIPSEVLVGPAEGLKHPSAVNLDHVQTISRVKLTRYIGLVGGEKMRSVCRALAIATGCAS
jgi:mRNA interferase MazF